MVICFSIGFSISLYIDPVQGPRVPIFHSCQTPETKSQEEGGEKALYKTDLIEMRLMALLRLRSRVRVCNVRVSGLVLMVESLGLKI